MMDQKTYLSRTYLGELDGLRALSILIVVSVHMKDHVWRWLGGHLGVSIFFVLSGYLITRLALKEERAAGRLNLSAFFTRRVFRLFPLYYVVLGFYCVLILGLGWSPEKRATLIAALPYYLTYFQEWPFFWGINGSFSNIPFYQTWSLGIEEKFYLAWPILGFVLWRGHDALRLWGSAILAVMIATASLLVWGPINSLLAPYVQILAGCFAALLLDTPAWYARLARLGSPRVGWAALVAILSTHFAIPLLEARYQLPAVYVYTATTTVFLVALILGEGPIQRVLRHPVLTTIGRLSYGMYLIHLFGINLAEKVARPGSGNPLTSLAALLLACVFSAAIAQVLSVAIERPGIAVGRRLSAAIRLGAPRAGHPSKSVRPEVLAP